MKRTILNAIVVSLVFYSLSSATIIHVPGQYSSIQEGIDVSSSGDTVLVQPGTYVENINFNGKHITLGSLFLTTSNISYITSTVIEGGTGSVVKFENREDTTAEIIGFTIQGGYAFWRGGGIFCSNSSPKISYNIIRDNEAIGDYTCGEGGGIYCGNSSPIIKSNVIMDNWAYDGMWMAFGKGGGIYCDNGSNPIIINNTIVRNREDFVWNGIRCEYSNPIITNTIFWFNRLNFRHSFPIITYCNSEGSWPGQGNISIDPLFRDPDSGDFHLMATYCGDPYNSPCIDAGDPSILDRYLDCDWGLGMERSDIGAFGGDDSIMVDVPEQESDVPIRYYLWQNYPNPFNSTTIIRYDLTNSSDVRIDIYNLMGQRVETLIDSEQSAGKHSVTWDASRMTSGIYFYKLTAGDKVFTKRMTLLK